MRDRIFEIAGLVGCRAGIEVEFSGIRTGFKAIVEGFGGLFIISVLESLQPRLCLSGCGHEE